MSGWISVSERLPGGSKEFLVTDGIEWAVASYDDLAGWFPEGISAYDADLSFDPTH